jgi:monoamine oxidase
MRRRNASLDISMHDFLNRHGATDDMIRLAYDTIPTYGMHARDVSSLLLAYISAYTRAQREIKPVLLQAKGGNQRIPEGMAGKLLQPVRFGQTVTAITADESGARIRTKGGGRYTAEAVICALPFSTLRRIKLEPELRGTQASAVQTLPHQQIHQIAHCIRRDRSGKRTAWRHRCGPTRRWGASRRSTTARPTTKYRAWSSRRSAREQRISTN